MKRYGNLFDKIVSIENIRVAHENAKRGKSHYREVKLVGSNPEHYLNLIRSSLLNKTYKTSDYINTEIFDGNKDRFISKLPYYPDRIVHWAIMNYLFPILLRSMIKQTYASIPRRGIHKMVWDIRNSLTPDHLYLKLDIKKYFPSVSNEKLKQLLRRKIKDPDLLWLLDEIIDSYPGLPIGNYTSQWFANFFLYEVDHLAYSLGIKYFRYMDDMVLLGTSESNLRIAFEHIKLKLNSLNLELNPSVNPTYPFYLPIDIVGYKIYSPNKVEIRSSIYQNIQSALDRNETSSLISYKGWALHSTSSKLERKIINRIKELKS